MIEREYYISSVDIFERRIEALCTIITNHTAEYWDERNKAVLSLITLVDYCDGLPILRIQELFNSNVFRNLKEPIKSMIADLRSQQVRDTCCFLNKLSYVCRDHIKSFLKDIFPFILDALKVPNKVMSGFVDDCISTMIKNATFKLCIPMIVGEIRECKAKHVREKCLEHVNSILELWDITNEKEIDSLQDAITLGLEDASVRSREIARCAYLNFRVQYNDRCDKIKSQLPSSLISRIKKLENDYDLESDECDFSSNKLKARRLSHVDEAVLSIQALMRGALTRRLSAVNDIDMNDTSDNNINANSLSSPLPSTSNISSSSTSGKKSKKLIDESHDNIPNHLYEGMHAKIGESLSSSKIQGVIKFIGLTSFSKGYWVGLHLNNPIGKNNGSVHGVQYFTCEPNYGIFVRPSQVFPIDNENIEPSSSSSNNNSNNIINSKSLKMIKLKLSKTMDILNQQLEIVEHLDKNSNVIMTKEYKNLFSQVAKLNQKELDICTEFNLEHEIENSS